MKMRKADTALFISLLLIIGNASGSPDQDVVSLLQKSKPAVVVFSDGTTSWTSKDVTVSRLDTAAIIVHTKELALDTDGAAKAVRACDRTSDAHTSLPGAHGNAVDSNSSPYFVLPWCGGAKNARKCKANPPYAQLGLQKGDLAAVISGDKLAFAIAADLGPEKKFGEGSVQLHRQLGHETIGLNPDNPKCAADISLTGDVYIVIFPRSNNRWRPKDEIDGKGMRLWRSLLTTQRVN